ncbi:hypothetical protein TEA_019859 [Camellia sinensis var. sinensis]|uniref:Uncharacterized protein n=1 Tax=Camellia sinensis var. sinensis TaxID=542762 RepID=A0A4S4EYA3_CAMSN|nr:hypothetical protein TEA_019859 [Camellia sinensis var. sinensis]
MPKLETQIKIDLTFVLGPLFFTWVILQLLHVILTSLVYKKQQKLRIMMKMHGLGDDPYWMITYAYFLVIYLAYMLCFVLFGSVIGLKFFTLNDYNIQFVFYFIYVNLQISLAFLVASIFANVKTVAVVGYIMVFGSGLLGGFLFQFFVEDTSFPSIQWVSDKGLVVGLSSSVKGWEKERLKWDNLIKPSSLFALKLGPKPRERDPAPNKVKWKGKAQEAEDWWVFAGKKVQGERVRASSQTARSEVCLPMPITLAKRDLRTFIPLKAPIDPLKE